MVRGPCEKRIASSTVRHWRSQEIYTTVGQNPRKLLHMQSSVNDICFKRTAAPISNMSMPCNSASFEVAPGSGVCHCMISAPASLDGSSQPSSPMASQAAAPLRPRRAE
eukprot:487791-Lingulodinium_polyedra.AAC.1